MTTLSPLWIRSSLYIRSVKHCRVKISYFSSTFITGYEPKDTKILLMALSETLLDEKIVIMITRVVRSTKS